MIVNSLILRIKQGDRTALEEIYRTYRSGFISWVVSKHGSDKERAKDIYQYAILSFYENVLEGVIENVTESGIKTYLYSIGKNKLLAEVRRDAKLSFQDEMEEETIVEGLEEPILDKEDQVKRLNKIISDLGSPCAEILELFYFNNLSAQEIADHLGYKNSNTVKNLKYKCLQKIKAQLK